MKKLKIGILSTARINGRSIIDPAGETPNVEIIAVASRKPRRAKKYAKKHKIPRYFGSYEELIADPEIDAVYISLPNSMHCEWTIKSLRGGKHVLCEKPISSNAEEAVKMKQVVDETGLILMEAFHFRYHPLAQRIKEIVSEGELGEIKQIYSRFCINMRNKKNIRFNYDLAGGGVMDVGCYAVSIIRMIGEGEPIVKHAHAKTMFDQIDTYLHGDLTFSNGTVAALDCSLITEKGGAGLKIEGTNGSLSCNGPFDSNGNNLDIIIDDQSRSESIKDKSTYFFQLQAFYDCILNKTTPQTDISDALANMVIIDDLYRKAGLKPRKIQ
jgi:predicted dehydrogenase